MVLANRATHLLQWNGLTEAFVRTMKRDYVDRPDLRSAAALLAQLSHCIADDNGVAPRSAVDDLAPQACRRQQQAQRDEQNQQTGLGPAVSPQRGSTTAT